MRHVKEQEFVYLQRKGSNRRSTIKEYTQIYKNIQKLIYECTIGDSLLIGADFLVSNFLSQKCSENWIGRRSKPVIDYMTAEER